MTRGGKSLAFTGLVAAGIGLALPPRAHRAAAPAPLPETGGALVVDLQDGLGDADLEAVSLAYGLNLRWLSPLTVDEALAVADAPADAQTIARLRSDPRVEVAEASVLHTAVGYPNDPRFEEQWNFRVVRVPEVWAEGHRGEGVIVAVVDTGIARVEDLEGVALLEGASFVPGVRSARDDQGHGTHVAGTIAQATNNGLGVAGLAPGTTLLPVKVLSASGSGQSEWIAAGIDYAVDQGAQVINLSLGGGYSAVIHQAVKKARSQGVLVVAAAGNSGRRGVSYPGALEEALGVAATGPDGARAPYSSFGAGVDLAAPGGDTRLPGGGILQDTIDGLGGHRYAAFQGTSMATPHVAGAAALLLGAGFGVDEVEERLLRSAVGGPWNEETGHGTLDIAAAFGPSAARGQGLAAVAAGVIALGLARLAGVGRTFALVGAFLAAVVAAGPFFLTWTGAHWPSWLLRPLLEWPAGWLGAWLLRFPPWVSAALPLLVAPWLAARRGWRTLGFGLCAGVAAWLLVAAWREAPLTWLPGGLGVAWLAVQALVSAGLAMSLAGVEKLDREGAA